MIPKEVLDCNCCECVARSPLFSVLNENEIKMISRNKATVAFKKGEIIRKQGTHLTHVVSLHSGLAKIYLEGSNPHNTIVRIVKPSNFIGGPGLYYDQLHHYSIAALTDSIICFIDLHLFKNLIDTNKQFAHVFLKDFSQNVISVYNRLVYLTQKQMPGRMADTLFYLFDDVFESPNVDFNLSKQDIADLSGMSKDSAVKILREFQKEGIIHCKDDKLILLDELALKRISRTG